MTHDPLCPLVGVEFVSGELCDSCDLIARVREDEAVKRRADLIWQDGYDIALQDAVEAVKKMRDGTVRRSVARSVLNQAVAAIEALGGER